MAICSRWKMGKKRKKNENVTRSILEACFSVPDPCALLPQLDQSYRAVGQHIGRWELDTLLTMTWWQQRKHNAIISSLLHMLPNPLLSCRWKITTNELTQLLLSSVSAYHYYSTFSSEQGADSCSPIGACSWLTYFFHRFAGIPLTLDLASLSFTVKV